MGGSRQETPGLVTVSASSALYVEPGRLPGALPRGVAELESLAVPGGPAAREDAPTSVFLTIDTEDAYFNHPILMTGEGVGREFGVFGILDELDARGMKATFFVNVYEADRQPPEAVERVVREIAERGHEVGLHSHPSPGSRFYGRPLFRLPGPQQAEILRQGVQLIEHWTGTAPLSFRAGGYALDDNTFAAMEQAGIAIDSSCFFPSENNRQGRFTVNAVARRGSIVEAPITTVLQIDGETVKHSKLDFNWLSVEELIGALGTLADHGAPFATFMMHSFSFIDKATRREGTPPAANALFTSEEVFGCYVDVLGTRPWLREAFGVFLDRIDADPRLRVDTLSTALTLLDSSPEGPDLVPVVGGIGP
jgi:peptidoglycan/xylan/chitin deacetylase (PgdA/CDA1 family)